VGVDLSPRGFGRILDAAFDLYRANFRSIVIASAAVLFPAALLVSVTQVFYTRGLLQVIPGVFAGDIPFTELDRVQIWSVLSNAVAPVFFIAQLYAGSAILSAAPAMLAGQRPGPWAILRGGWARFGWLIIVSLAVSVLTGISAIPLLFPALFVWARLSVARVVTIIEAAPLDRALARSWSLTGTNTWRTIGFAIALALITIALETAVTAPSLIRQVVASVGDPEAIFAPLSAGWKTFEGALSAVAVALVFPFAQLAWFFYYLDLRARREGMDLLVSAGELSARKAGR
jgi:hypothetical protein